MAVQMSFYLTQDDHAEVERVMSSKIHWEAYHRRVFDGSPKRIDTTVVQNMGSENLGIVVGPRGCLESLIFNRIRNQEYETMDILRSPVIEFSRCFEDKENRVFRKGRLYFDSGYYHQNCWVEKDDSIKKWVRSFFRYFKAQMTKREDGYYYGPMALGRVGEWILD